MRTILDIDDDILQAAKELAEREGKTAGQVLLGLAVKNGGRLVTFNRGLPLKAVRGAEARHLVVL